MTTFDISLGALISSWESGINLWNLVPSRKREISEVALENLSNLLELNKIKGFLKSLLNYLRREWK